MLDQKRLPYQLKLNLFYLKKHSSGRQVSTQLTAGRNTIDDIIFIVKFGQNSFLYGHQHNRLNMFLVIALRRWLLILLRAKKDRSYARALLGTPAVLAATCK